MKISGKVVVVTGGASGIGRALCRRFAAEGAKRVVVADRDLPGAERVAREIGGLAVRCDVGVEDSIKALVEAAGDVDVFCSNAGVAVGGDVFTDDAVWDLGWRVHVMASVWAARAVVPGMLARGGGAFVITASAAGLLSNIGAAPYAATKHAAVALAEWLTITYGARGLQVACLCPMGVDTAMLADHAGEPAIESVRAAGAVLSAEQVAGDVLAALEDGRFLILPHPQVADFERHRAGDRESWLAGMRRFASRLPK